MNNLIEAIKQEQKKRGLTDTRLAELLGIDRTTWAKIKGGKRTQGMKFLRAVAREFPDLMDVIHFQITSGLSTTPSEKAQNRKLRRLYLMLMETILRTINRVFFRGN